jgi:hypothetical protein
MGNQGSSTTERLRHGTSGSQREQNNAVKHAVPCFIREDARASSARRAG